MGTPTVTPLQEGFHNGGFIVSTANGHQSFSTGVLLAGTKYGAGMVLGKVTASGKFKQYNPAAADGSQNVAAILYADSDATANDKPATVVDWGAEVNASELVWFGGATGAQITAGLAGLAGLRIKAV